MDPVTLVMLVWPHFVAISQSSGENCLPQTVERASTLLNASEPDDGKTGVVKRMDRWEVTHRLKPLADEYAAELAPLFPNYVFYVLKVHHHFNDVRKPTRLLMGVGPDCDCIMVGESPKRIHSSCDQLLDEPQAREVLAGVVFSIQQVSLFD